VFHRSTDVRYVGQDHELNVQLDDNFCGKTSDLVRQRFYEKYTELFGRAITDVPNEILNLRLTASCPLGQFDFSRATAPPAEPGAIQHGCRQIYISEHKRYQEVPVYDHQHLPIGYLATGPALIEQRESTVVVGPGDRVEVDKLRNLVIKLAGGKENSRGA